MKRLILLTLLAGAVLLGACRADVPVLPPAEAPDFIWGYVLHSLPEGYTRNDFQADTRAATYHGQGIWSFSIYGSGNERKSRSMPFGELDDWDLSPETIATMKSTLYSAPGDETEQSVYDYCRNGNCRDNEVIERQTVTYQLKLTAEFDETRAVFNSLDVERFDEETESQSFLLLPEAEPCGCCCGFKEIRIK